MSQNFIYTHSFKRMWKNSSSKRHKSPSKDLVDLSLNVVPCSICGSYHSSDSDPIVKCGKV